jgi:hypothetical protein
MTARPARPIASMLLALAGPIVWLAHFFALYLAEAFLCTFPGPGSTMTLRTMAVVLTVLATLVLSVAASGYASGFSGFDGSNPSSTHLALARPLALLSILAVLWTFVPAVLLPACTPGAG